MTAAVSAARNLVAPYRSRTCRSTKERSNEQQRTGSRRSMEKQSMATSRDQQTALAPSIREVGPEDFEMRIRSFGRSLLDVMDWPLQAALYAAFSVEIDR